MQNKKQAFTLVELIVVITILAILGTIAFISLQGYSRNSRDSVRVGDIGIIKTSLELFHLDGGKYPKTTSGSSITYKGSEVWEQGTFGNATLINVGRLDKIPLDPLTDKEYTYSKSINNTEYSVAGIIESSDLVLNGELVTNIYAGDKIINAYVDGNYNGVFTKTSTGGVDYVLATPSIITSSTGTDLINIISSKELVYNNFQNLPSNYTESNYDVSGGFDFAPDNIEIFTGSLVELETDKIKRVKFLNNIQKAYGKSVIDDEPNILNMLEFNADKENSSIGARNLVSNILENKLNIEKKEIESEWDVLPEDIRQIFATGSVYTQHWEINNCDPDTMTVVEVEPGVNPFSGFNNTSANTVYKLKDGDYILPAPLSFNGDCIGIIGEDNTVIYSSIYFSFYAPIYGTKSNSIIANIKIDGINNPEGSPHQANYEGIIVGGSNSTFTNIESYNNTYGILAQGPSYNNNYYYNLRLHDNITYGLHLFGHDNIINDITVYNNNYGIRLARAKNNILMNITAYNNSTGLNMTFDSDNNIIKNINAYNNNTGISISGDGGTVSSGNILSNLNLYNNVYSGISFSYSANNNTINNLNSYNNDKGISIYGAHMNIFNNISLYNNLTHGIRLEYVSETNNILNNVRSFNNGGYGVYFASSLAIDNKYYGTNYMYGNPLGAIRLYTANNLTSGNSTDIVIQNINLNNGNLIENQSFGKNDMIIPKVKGWDYTLKGPQCLVGSGCTNEVLTESFDENIEYTIGKNVGKQSELIKYNTGTLKFEYYGTEFDDYNTYMRIGDF